MVVAIKCIPCFSAWFVLRGEFVILNGYHLLDGKISCTGTVSQRGEQLVGCLLPLGIQLCSGI